MKKIVLASSSPRRRRLLKQIGLRFTIDASCVDESYDRNLSAKEITRVLAFKKAQAVSKKYKEAIIISADSLVVCDNVILGKAGTPGKAKQMLRRLSGKRHFGITSFTIWDCETGKNITKTVQTKVYFKKLSDLEIEEYIATGEPLDKAGAYGIQERGAAFVDKIDGDFSNVVGLPLSALVEELKHFNIDVLSANNS